MGVDDEFDGLGRELFDLLDEDAGGGRFGVRVDDEDAIAENDDGGVAIYFVGGLGDGSVDTVGHGLDVEQVFTGGGDGDAGDWEQEKKEEQEARLHGRDLRMVESDAAERVLHWKRGPKAVDDVAAARRPGGYHLR
jgi:hypothetical protein